MKLPSLGDSGEQSLACYSSQGCRVRQDLVTEQQIVTDTLWFSKPNFLTI